MLRNELARRKAKNARYSLRAFSAYLKLDPAALSRILNGKQEISIRSSAFAVRKLGLTGSIRRLFIAAVAEDKMNRAYALLANALTDTSPREDGDVPRGEWSDLGLGHHVRSDSVLSMNPDLMTLMDLDGRVIFCNENFARTIQRIPCEIVGHTYSDIGIPSDIAARLSADDRAAIETGEERRTEVNWRTVSGISSYERYVKPVRKEDGTISALFSLYRSFSESSRFRFLWEATNRFEGRPNERETRAAIVRECVPQFADAASIVRLGTEDSSHDAASDFAGDVALLRGLTDSISNGATSNGSTFIAPFGERERLVFVRSTDRAAFDATAGETAIAYAERAYLALENARRRENSMDPVTRPSLVPIPPTATK